MTIDNTLNLLIDPIQAALKPALDSLDKGQPAKSLGLRRSAHLPVLAAIYKLTQKPLLLVTDRADRALSIIEELNVWLPAAPKLLFPEPTPMFYENASWGESTRRDRLTAFTTLARYHIPGASHNGAAPVLVTSARALMTRSMPRREFLKSVQMVKIGQIIQLDDLARKCHFLGYESVSTVIAPGQIARRGGILDIWSTGEEVPTRLEFFGDEIDTIKSFDPASQRTIRQSDESSKDRVLITPAREYVLKVNNDLDLKSEEISEFLIPMLHKEPASILDYLPRNSIVLIDNHQALEDAFEEIEEQAIGSRYELIKEQMLSADFPIPYLTYGEICDTLSMLQVLELAAFLVRMKLNRVGSIPTSLVTGFQAVHGSWVN